MRALQILTSLLGLSFQCLAAETPAQNAGDWSHSIVLIESTRKQYDYLQPWSKRMKSGQKTGIVVGEREILTTADELYDRTLIRLQKGGRGKWWIGDVTWIDYHANLALVTTTDESFWRDLTPAKLDSAIPSETSLQILRWREGKLENRKAEFTQYSVKEGRLASVSHVQLETSTEMRGNGWGEPLVANSHVIGIISAQDGSTCTAMPASFVASILDARKKGTYRGLGYFDFYWQPGENPASLAAVKLEGELRGVLVIDVPAKPDGPPPTLKPRDVILEIDGFAIDTDGDYTDPEFGHLMLENLSTRRKWAGDEIKMKISRDGKILDVTYKLPKFEYNNSLLPDAVFDQEPEYLIIGGLVFQPLTDTFLQSWGPEWKRRSPFRLYYFNNEPRTREQPSRVVLSQVLPDEINIGYQEIKYLVLEKFNGQPVRKLADIRASLDKSTNGFHIIECFHSDSLRRIVIEAGPKERQSTQRVLQRYGIAEEFYIASPDAKSASTGAN